MREPSTLISCENPKLSCEKPKLSSRMKGEGIEVRSSLEHALSRYFPEEAERTEAQLWRYFGCGVEREFFIDNLLVRIHFIIAMIRWTGLAPWEFDFPFPGSLTSTFLAVEYPPYTLRHEYQSLFADAAAGALAILDRHLHLPRPLRCLNSGLCFLVFV